MTGPVAVCAGEATLDLIRVRSSTAAAPTYEAHPGGAPVNVAAGLAAHGIPSVLWSAVGRDPAGDTVRAALARFGIALDALSVDENHPTRIAFIEPAEGGSRVTRIQNADSADQYLHPASLPPALASCPLFYFSGAALLGETTTTAILTALRALRARTDVLIAFDPNIRLGRSARADQVRARFAEVLDYVDVLQVAEHRFATYFEGVPSPTLAHLPLRILTRGAGGAVLETPEARVDAAPVPATVVDTTGAGDAFLAALLSRLTHLDRRTLASADEATLASWSRFAAGHAAAAVAHTGGSSAYLSTGPERLT